jgi:hypothetical protein
LKKAPFETAKTFLMGSAKLYGFCKPMLPCRVAAFFQKVGGIKKSGLISRFF